MSKKKWEEVAENTWRLGVEGGWLYRVGASLAFVPTGIGESLDTLACALDEIATHFDSAMFSVGHGGGRAIRTCDIGD
jgi:hypothetical protein